jgi:hypothetical protein
MKTRGEVDEKICFVLTSALVGAERSVSRADRFAPGENEGDAHWAGGCVGLRTGRHGGEKIFVYAGIRTQITLFVQPVASLYSDCIIQANKKIKTNTAEMHYVIKRKSM